MKEADIITITLKGQKAKEYFLEKITKNFGVRFKDIPKEPLVIEEKGSSEMVVEIFKDLLELKILKLFVTSKYIHILNEIFKNDMFSVEAIRQKSDYADIKALTEVIGVLDNEAIHYSQNEDGTYNVDNVWRTYLYTNLA